MNKNDTKKAATLLFLHMFKTAEMIGNQTEIFDQMPEGKNFEPLFLYSFALYEVHNQTHENHLPEDIFDDCMAEFYQYLIEKGIYSLNEVKERLPEANMEMVDFATAHVSFITGGSEYGLMQYVPAILSKFPTARATRIFSYEGTAFATLMPELIEKVSAAYNEVLSEWNKSLKAHQKATASLSDDFIIETYPPAATKPVEQKKKPVALIICVVALICSLAGNFMLASRSNSGASEEVVYWEEAYNDIFLTCYQLADEMDNLKEEYLFYREFAVVVSETNNYYHRHSCDNINFDNFWIYNIEYAKYLGHSACPECNPDNHASWAIRQNLEGLIEDSPQKPMGPYKP